MHADCVPILQDVPPGEPIGGCSVAIAGQKQAKKSRTRHNVCESWTASVVAGMWQN